MVGPSEDIPPGWSIYVSKPKPPRKRVTQREKKLLIELFQTFERDKTIWLIILNKPTADRLDATLERRLRNTRRGRQRTGFRASDYVWEIAKILSAEGR